MRTKTKYRNQPTHGFASKREYRRYQELALLEKAGEISDLQTQVPFIFEELKYASGRKVKYVADFTYMDNDSKYIVEDAKGYATQVYKLKKVLMKYFFGINIREI